MRSFYIEFDHLPTGKTMNDYVHWAVKKKARDEVQKAVHKRVSEMREEGRLFDGWPDNPIKRCHIYFRFYIPDKRRRDPDNTHTATKTYIDNLVGLRILEDDGFEQIRKTIIDSEYRKNQPGFSILILEVEDGGA